MVDMVVSRLEMRKTIARIIGLMTKQIPEQQPVEEVIEKPSAEPGGELDEESSETRAENDETTGTKQEASQDKPDENSSAAT